MPVIEAIAPDTAALPIEKAIPDKVSSKAISTKTASKPKAKLTYEIAKDGSVVTKSIRGITRKEFIQLSDRELKAHGLFRDESGLHAKYFEIRDNAESKPKQKAVSVGAERFTAQQAIAYYTQKSGKPLGEKSFTQNAKKYGFAIKERGSGLYALIEP